MNKTIFFLICILCLILFLSYFLIPVKTKKPSDVISVEKSEAHIVLLTFNSCEDFNSNDKWTPPTSNNNEVIVWQL